MASAKYDRQEVIRKATDLFWSRGFHATSMRNIQQAIDMRPGSIYACFGSKEGLFKEVLAFYAEANRARLEACLQAAPSALEGLKQFFRASVTGMGTSAPNEMCMLIKSIAELTEEDGELLADAKQRLRQVEETFAQILRRAQQQGDIDPSRDPSRMARYLQVQLMGLRAYARANGADAELRRLIEDAFAYLTGDA